MQPHLGAGSCFYAGQGMCPCSGALWGKLRLFPIPHGLNVFRVKLAVKVCVECGVYETTYFKQS